MWFFGKKQLKSGVCVESVVSMHAEALDELEGLSVGKNVVSSCASAGGVRVASVLVVDSSPLCSMGSYVEPGLAIQVVVEGLNVFGFGIEVAENECGAIRVSEFLVKDGLEHSVGFSSRFFVGGSSSVAVGVVGSRIDNVVDVEICHVETAGGFVGLPVVVGAWWNVEGFVS